MPIRMNWDDEEKTIYRCTVSGRWTLHEFLDCNAMFHSDMGQVSHLVITIVDLRGAKLTSGTLIDAIDVIRTRPVPNADIIIAISGSGLWQRTFNTIQQLFGGLFPVFNPRVRWVTSDREAYQVIAKHRSLMY
jgi:hypothetical protein